MSSDLEKRMTQYLLGQLPEEEQAELERQYLADDGLFQELLATEDDLRDAYVRGELSQSDRKAFQERLLATPRQQQDQQFARNLHQYFVAAGNQAVPQAQSAFRWKSLLRVFSAQPPIVLIPAASLIVLLLMAGSWWLGRESVQPPQLSSGNNPPGTTAHPAGGLEPEARTMTFLLGRLSRGEQESKPLLIPPEVNQVRLQARTEANYPHYQAVLQTAENRLVWSSGNLEAHPFPGGNGISVDLPSSLLPPGDYVLTIRGLPTAGPPETAAEYAFHVGKN